MKTCLKRYISIVFLILFTIAIGYSSYNLYLSYSEKKSTDNLTEELINEYISDSSIDIDDSNNDTQNNSSSSFEDNTQSSAKHQSDKTQKLLDINFTALKKRNNDVVAWLHIPNTTINYPILKGETNDTYLRTNIDKKSSNAGSIFLNSTNNSNFYDKRTIVYGHNMKSKQMFHDLRNYSSKSYLDAHNQIYVYLEDYILVYTVEYSKLLNKEDSIYEIIAADYESVFLYQNSTGENKQKYLEDIYNNNQLILSTCYQSGSDERRIVVAKIAEIIDK